MKLCPNRMSTLEDDNQVLKDHISNRLFYIALSFFTNLLREKETHDTRDVESNSIYLPQTISIIITSGRSDERDHPRPTKYDRL